MTTWQFNRFHVAAGREQAVKEAWRASLQPCWTARPALQAAYLIRVGDGEWLDITVWAGQDCGETADPSLPQARAGFFGHIDELIGDECGMLISQETPPEPPSPSPAAAGPAGGSRP
jgi:hypothetical protein